MEKLPRSNPAFRSTNKNAIRCQSRDLALAAKQERVIYL